MKLKNIFLSLVLAVATIGSNFLDARGGCCGSRTSSCCSSCNTNSCNTGCCR